MITTTSLFYPLRVSEILFSVQREKRTLNFRSKSETTFKFSLHLRKVAKLREDDCVSVYVNRRESSIITHCTVQYKSTETFVISLRFIQNIYASEEIRKNG